MASKTRCYLENSHDKEHQADATSRSNADDLPDASGQRTGRSKQRLE